MRLRAKLYVGSFYVVGIACFGYAMAHWKCADPLHYLCLFATALIVSRLKLSLPGIQSELSVSYIFVIASILDFSYPEAAVLGCVAGIAESFWKGRRLPQVLEAGFRIATMNVAVAIAYSVFHVLSGDGQILPICAGAAALCYFLVNTVCVAGGVGLMEQRSVLAIWNESYFWSFPYYVTGAAIAVVMNVLNDRVGWRTVLLGVAAVYVCSRICRFVHRRMDPSQDDAEQIAGLHLRTIEALALAIEAKDETSHEHLQRVQVYAVELGKKMGLNAGELQALRAASILHDIGKLAVPEHIMSKPGKLTPEEFEKMKIHPIVGSEILARVQFPYPVGPIVRSHHEKWDGTGYPDGLTGEAIPLGARVLTAVDCLDALASDRQYRRALPLDEAMAVVAAESGSSFDPKIVRILQENYRHWEKLASAKDAAGRRVSKQEHVANESLPAAALQTGDSHQPEFLTSIAAARQEALKLYELTQDLGNSLNLHETLSVLDSRLQRLIRYDAMAVYILREGCLWPEYVNGANCRLFSSLRIPVGQGLSGWVAETGKPIVNGNPSVEPGYLNDPSKFSKLRSALAVPLENAVGVIGVLALYRLERDAFKTDDLRVLLAINPKVSLAIENALKFQHAAISATTDVLTLLPNARSLFLHLDGELSRARRNNETLAVLLCDLDGFKQVNDRFGHLEGNRVLQLVAAGLRECCREYDYVARMGGDEFVLVLPGLTPADLFEKTQALERVVVEAGITVCGERLLNISVGAAFSTEHGTDAEGLLAEADRRMYVVKQQHKCGGANPSSDLTALAESMANAEAGEELPERSQAG